MSFGLFLSAAIVAVSHGKHDESDPRAQCDIACDRYADWSPYKTCFSAYYTDCIEIECYDLSLTECLSPSSVHNCVINVGTNNVSYCAANTDEGPNCKTFQTSKTDCEANDCVFVEDASVNQPSRGNQSLCRTKKRSDNFECTIFETADACNGASVAGGDCTYLAPAGTCISDTYSKQCDFITHVLPYPQYVGRSEEQLAALCSALPYCSLTTVNEECVCSSAPNFDGAAQPDYTKCNVDRWATTTMSPTPAAVAVPITNETFCSEFASVCGPEGVAAYDDCAADFAAMAKGETGATGGDNQECRMYHLGVARTTDTKFHCGHASSTGEGVCIPEAITADNFCSVFDEVCADESVAYSDCAVDFTTHAVGNAGAVGGDSQECRIYHLGVARSTDASVHCPHAAKDGDGVCAAQTAVTTPAPTLPPFTGQKFYWQPNTMASNPSNWVTSGVEMNDTWGAVDMDVACVSHFGSEGALISFDEDMTLTEITFPDSGVVELGDDIEITFDDAVTDKTTKWACDARDTTCSQNYKIVVDDAYVTPDRAPCHNDVMQIDGSKSHSINFHPGQHVARIEVKMDSELMSYGSNDGAFLDAWESWNGQVSGFMPSLGPSKRFAADHLEMSCADACVARPEHTPEEPTAYFESVEEEARDVTYKQGLAEDAINQVYFLDPVKKTAMYNEVKRVNDEFVKENTNDDTAQGKTTLNVAVTSKGMLDWIKMFENLDISDKTMSAIEHVFTTGLIDRSLTYLNAQSPSDRSLWWKNKDTDESGSTAPMRSPMEFFVADGLMNNGLLSAMSKAGIQATFDSLDKASVTAADSNGNPFITGETPPQKPGQFKFANVGVSGNLTMDGGALLASPAVVNMVFSSVCTKFALNFHVQELDAQIVDLAKAISSKTVSPTVTPTAFPSMSPTFSPTSVELGLLEGSMGPVIYGAGGGAILVILIIIIVCLVGGGSKKSSNKADRNVVAFENPMYDDPTAAQGGNVQQQVDEDGGLYDEPTFNAGANDKENPMYQSNENEMETTEGGGYLDVEPDDEDDSSDEDE